MKISRRRCLEFGVGLAATTASRGDALGQSYPHRPLRWLVGFPPGGASSTVVRIAAERLSDRLRQPVVVENKPGASGNLSIQAAINAPADGHTLVVVSTTSAINTGVYERPGFDLLRDIAPVAALVEFPLVMIVHPSVPAARVPEFIHYAKERPGKINMASFGTATTSHVAGELFKAMAGVDMVHVPYRGEAAALVDLMAGRVEVMFDVLTGCLPHIRSGRLRAIAFAGKASDEALPGVPTIGESVPGYAASSWLGVGVHASTSPSIIEKLNAEINAGLVTPATKSLFSGIAARPMVLSSRDFSRHLADEAAKWGSIVRRLGIKPA